VDLGKPKPHMARTIVETLLFTFFVPGTVAVDMPWQQLLASPSQYLAFFAIVVWTGAWGINRICLSG
jgi:hypothetical protein